MLTAYVCVCVKKTISLSLSLQGNRFFRVAPGYLAQFGVNDNPKWTAYWLKRRMPDELMLDDPTYTPHAKNNQNFTMAFAREANVNSGSQVFINLRDNSQLFENEKIITFGIIVNEEGQQRLHDLFPAEVRCDRDQKTPTFSRRLKRLVSLAPLLLPAENKRGVAADAYLCVCFRMCAYAAAIVVCGMAALLNPLKQNIALLPHCGQQAGIDLGKYDKVSIERVIEEGGAYLDSFPKLSNIKHCRIIESENGNDEL